MTFSYTIELKHGQNTPLEEGKLNMEIPSKEEISPLVLVYGT